METWPGFCRVCGCGPQKALRCKAGKHGGCGIRRTQQDVVEDKGSIIPRLMFLMIGLGLTIGPALMIGAMMVVYNQDMLGCIIGSIGAFAFSLVGSIFAVFGAILVFGRRDILQPVDDARVAAACCIGPFPLYWEFIDITGRVSIPHTEGPPPALPASITALEPGKGLTTLTEMWHEAKEQVKREKMGDSGHRINLLEGQDVLKKALAACLEQGWLTLECAEIRLASYWLMDSPERTRTYYLRAGANAARCIGDVERKILDAVAERQKESGENVCGLGATWEQLLKPFRDADSEFSSGAVMDLVCDEAVRRTIFEKIPGSLLELRWSTVRLSECRSAEWFEARASWDRRLSSVLETEPAFWNELDAVMANKAQSSRQSRFTVPAKGKHQIHKRRLAATLALLFLLNLGLVASMAAKSGHAVAEKRSAPIEAPNKR